VNSPLQFWHHHGAMSVPDIEAAIAWWESVLDFKVTKRFNIPAIPAEVAMLQNGPLHIELFEVAGATSLPQERREPDTDLLTHGNKHVSFAVHDVEPFAEELKRRGADIVWVRKMPHGSNIFIRDLAGNLIEFVAEPKPDAELGLLSRRGQ
jgi:methylmalonyl-CoA/ethylmalonyl-CoA epimerase